MDVGLATLEVIVQVVPEQMDQVDGVVPCVSPGVAGKQNECDVADALPCPRISVLQPHWRLPVNVNTIIYCK